MFLIRKSIKDSNLVFVVYVSYSGGNSRLT